MYDEKPDAILLNEIKPKNGKIHDLRTLNIPGYNLYLNDIDDSNTRGVAVYVNSLFKSPELKVQDHTFKDVVTVSLNIARKKNILLQCIYRSGTRTTAMSNDEEMYKLITRTAKLNGYIHKTICGDFNLSKIDWSPDPSNPTHAGNNPNSPEEKFLDCINDVFLNQHLNEKTRYRLGHNATQPDLVFSTSEMDISNIMYEDGFGGSDHVTVKFNLATEIPPLQQKKTILKYDKGNYTKMKELLDLDWESLLKGKSINDSVQLLEDKINEAVKICIPTKEIGKDERRRPLWMNENALRKVKRKHASWIRYLNTKQGRDFIEFTKHRNEASRAIKRARREFETIIAKDVRKNPKGVWNYMKSNRKVRSRIPNLKKADKTFTETDEEITEELNKQYYNVFTKEILDNMPTFIPKHLVTNALSEIEVSEKEVFKQLKNLKPRKAAGLDNMQPVVLREVAAELSKPLKIIYQLSLNTGTLPLKWLQAGVVPVFKKGSTTDPANYRPVSLTSVLCKVLEKIVVNCIIEHIKKNQLTTKVQHGFTPKKSITTNLLEVLNIWSEALMHNIPVDIIYLDYAKAFDTVPHKRLIKQVETFGIQGQVLKWIQAFLTDRKQKVLVNGVESSWSPVESGIPQGSILGPILFTLFVNDIPSNIKTFISMYADDTKIYSPLASDENALELVEDLAYVQEWARKMQMRFHPSKCKVMHLGQNNPKYDYYMQDKYTESTCQQHTLEKTLLEKDLGVFVDSELDFSWHVIEKVNKANKLLGYLRHSFKHLNKQSLSMLYKSIIRPHLEFASCIWAPKHQYNIQRLEKVQQRATRMVPELRNFTYEQRLCILKLETLSYRRMRSDLIEAYRIISGQHEVDTNCYCSLCPTKAMLSTPNCTTTTRGNSKKLQIHNATKARQHFFDNRIAKFWNDLPESAVCSENVESFKNQIDKYFGHLKHNPDFRY